jgi:hypothetical protein
MVFGRKHNDRSREYRWFAWYPVHLDDGRWAWLTRVLRWTGDDQNWANGPHTYYSEIA